MSQPLSVLCADLPDQTTVAAGDPLITSLTDDSREVVPGALFCARQGFSVSGAAFVKDAIARGASAILCEQADAKSVREQARNTPLPIIAFADLFQQVGTIAARFYGFPSRVLRTHAVTGTNGKTSTSHFLAQALTDRGLPCGVMGTLGYGPIHQALMPIGLTTPQPIALQAGLASLREAGMRALSMEASSHALDQQRLQALDVHTAIFTNLTRDHLDYHGTMEAYGAAKAKLFQRPELSLAVLNEADPFSAVLALQVAKQVSVWRYTIGEPASRQRAVGAKDLVYSLQGIQASVFSAHDEASLQIPLWGAFNVSNVLAVVATLSGLGLTLQEAVASVAKLRPVPGRMEVHRAEGKPTVVVDYAHTPDALAKALAAVRQHSQGKVCCVFGCGGNRDQGKRPLMAEVAAKGADETIVTTDNPRDESPDAIVNEIIKGFPPNYTHQWVLDRASAIEFAIEQAKPDDVILLAGKGHERTQEVEGLKLPFSDRAVVMELLGCS